jgi:hypothetical protein
MLVINIASTMYRFIHSHTKLHRLDYGNEFVHWGYVWIMTFKCVFSILVQIYAKELSHNPVILVLYNFDTFLYPSSSYTVLKVATYEAKVLCVH